MNDSRCRGFVPLLFILIAVLTTTAVSGAGYGVYKYQKTAKENAALREKIDTQKEDEIKRLEGELETYKTPNQPEQASSTEEKTLTNSKEDERVKEATQEEAKATAKRAADDAARIASQKAAQEESQRAAQETARLETQRLADEAARAEAQRIAEEEAQRVAEENARIVAAQAKAQKEAQEAAKEKQDKLDSINREIADLNAKYASDVANVDNDPWITQGVSDRRKQALYQQYLQDYNLLKAEWQQVYYSN